MLFGMQYVLEVTDLTTNDKITVSVTEAAQLLGLSRPTVYKLIHRGDFPVLRVGTRTLIHRARLEEWAERQMEKQRS